MDTVTFDSSTSIRLVSSVLSRFYETEFFCCYCFLGFFERDLFSGPRIRVDNYTHVNLNFQVFREEVIEVVRNRGSMEIYIYSSHLDQMI